MAIGTNPDYEQAFAAALDWWREAGVDSCFVDEPRTWLPPAETTAPSRQNGKDDPAPADRNAPPPPPAPLELPQDLDAFRTWWLTAPELDGGRLSGRVAPRGEAAAKLMILAPMPEGADGERLLSGPEGALLGGFVRACGLSEDAVYWASALPCHAPGADWSAGANPAAAQALARHVALVRPERLLVIGYNVLPLLGHSSPQGPAVSLNFNHEGASVPMLAVRRVPATASQPRWKAALWRAWLDWAVA